MEHIFVTHISHAFEVVNLLKKQLLGLERTWWADDVGCFRWIALVGSVNRHQNILITFASWGQP